MSNVLRPQGSLSYAEFESWVSALSILVADCVEAMGNYRRLMRQDNPTIVFQQLAPGLSMTDSWFFKTSTQLAKLFSEGSNQDLTFRKFFAALNQSAHESWLTQLMANAQRDRRRSKAWQDTHQMKAYLREAKLQIQRCQSTIRMIEHHRNNVTAHTRALHSKRKDKPMPDEDLHIREVEKLVRLAREIHDRIHSGLGLSLAHFPFQKFYPNFFQLDDLISVVYELRQIKLSQGEEKWFENGPWIGTWPK